MTTTTIASRLDRLPITSWQRLLFLVIATSWLFDAMDIGTMSFVLGSIRTSFSLNSAQAGLLGSASFFGMFLGAALAGLLADRFGRRPVLQWSIVLWGLASLLCALAPSYRLLLLFRVLLGIGMAMELPVAQSLLCEFMPARERGRSLALLEGLWPIGFILSGLLAYLILPHAGWRGVFASLAAPAVLVLVVRRVVPESPRWLESHGRIDEASTLLSTIEARVARASGSPLPPPAGTSAALASPAVAVPGRSRISELWQLPYGHRTLMLWLLWFFALLGFYGLTTWLSALLQQAGFTVSSSVLYTVLISLAGIPGFLTSAWLVERWGRKPTAILTLIGSALMAFLYGRVAVHGGTPAQFVPFGLAMQFFMFGMWSVLYAYTPELYPTRCRATGVGFASSIGRIGSLIGPSLFGLILPSAGQTGVFAIGAGCFLLAALVVFALGIETKGQPLEVLSP